MPALQAASAIGQEAIRARADVDIAEIQSDTTKYTAALQAGTVKYTTDVTRDISFNNLDATLRINENNQKGQTERLAMQLAELRAARADALRSEMQARQIEAQYKMQEMQLRFRLEDDRYALGKMTLQQKLIEQGLVSGVNTINPTSGPGIAQAPLTARASFRQTNANSLMASLNVRPPPQPPKTANRRPSSMASGSTRIQKLSLAATNSKPAALPGTSGSTRQARGAADFSGRPHLSSAARRLASTTHYSGGEND